MLFIFSFLYVLQSVNLVRCTVRAHTNSSLEFSELAKGCFNIPRNMCVWFAIQWLKIISSFECVLCVSLVVQRKICLYTKSHLMN